MSVSLGKSTYDNIIGDVREDFQEEGKLSALGDELFINFVLRAEERICSLIDVKEEYVLRIASQVDEYLLRDRPPVTDVTNAIPAVVASSGHGLSTGDIIWQQMVVGKDNANGRFKATVIDAGSFQIVHLARIQAISGDTPRIVTSKNHPFVTGNVITVSGVTVETALNTNWTVTKLDTNRFSLNSSVPDANLVANVTNAVATKDLASTGTYVSGGRYWKEDEIPTYFRSWRFAQRVTSGRMLNLESALIDEMGQWKQMDGSLVYSTLAAPGYIGMSRRDGAKYLKFYPIPQTAEDITLFGIMQITPRDYFETEKVGTPIHLSSEYDQMIKAFVKARAYERLKDLKMSAVSDAVFLALRREYLINQSPRSIPRRMVYA